MADAPVTFLPLGAIIQELLVGGVNIVQGFPEQSQYESHNDPFFGETIGRVANRIKGAQIDSLNGGKSYALAANNGPNNLHGGVVGWGKKIWDGPKPVGVREIPGFAGLDGGESVKFSLVSPDGDEGFPGAVQASVVYTVGKQLQEGKDVIVLGIEYEAELVGGADETVINMTNHSYFNLTGGPSIEGTVVTLATNSYLPVDEGGIPTSGPKAFATVQGGKAFTLGAVEPDIDDCFVINEAPNTVPIDTRSLPAAKLVSAHHPESKIHLEVYSTEPAFQFYTGKYISVPEVAGVPARNARSGFCVEPSRYVNACNVDEWKGQMLLKKGEKYGCRIVYRAWKE
ncbi:galactose mutarotase-like domain-containing protein [Lasiosphaeria miniovina]|uniref:Galactose mutarotase-like domain-containing protein n=1 Tax=Lasiosphaeria miniovina TaxID=1954250 RepID=A0AA40AC79_9PEZI|nr:galactose mutarotase-like domain-containing protein [Lasiosphaeria miniovina]KAK0713206.1 galactose mutarotase-like domain-containing protein [Lasiosphaeria miniovina]